MDDLKRTERYGPIEWLHTRPHGRLVGTGDHARRDRALSTIRQIDPDPVFGEQRQLIAWGAFEDGLDAQAVLDAMEDEPGFISWEYCRSNDMEDFVADGRNIFHFDGEMTRNITGIAMDEVLTEDLSHPYGSYYLVFDGAADFDIDGRPIDGVMVNVIPYAGDHLSNVEAVQLLDRTEDRLARNMGHRDYNSLPPHLASEVHGRALSLVMPHSMLNVSFWEQSEAGPWHLRREKGRAYQIPLVRGRGLIEAIVKRSLNVDEICKTKSERDIFRPLPDMEAKLRLVFNAILYIMRYAADRPTEWQPGAPADLVEKALQGKRKADQELRRGGYVRTRMVRFRDDGGDSLLTGDSAGGIRPHWRKAHWARQRCGKGGLDRKLILRRQARVAFKEGDADPGLPDLRVYT